MLDGTLPLTDPQHEQFAQLIARGDQSQGACYARAYGREVDNTAYANASRLLRNARVQVRITYLKEAAADKACLDASYILSRLVMNSEAARDVKQYAASNRALELIGKYLSIFSDGYVTEDERAPKDLPDFDSMNREELRRWRDENLRN